MKEIKKYIITLDKYAIDNLKKDIDKKGPNDVFKDIIKELDCTKVYDCGRPMQTINYRYYILMSQAFYILNYIVGTEYKPGNDYDIDNLFQLLLDTHNKNIEYEKLNPPIKYDKEEIKEKRKKKNKKPPVEGIVDKYKPKFKLGMCKSKLLEYYELYN